MTNKSAVADATGHEELLEQTDNGPEPGQPVPDQDPTHIPGENA